MSALDMSLEDVIKSKGGNSKRPVRSAKAPSNGTKKVQNTERPKRNTATAVAGIGTALKAAAAAAVAASKPAPALSKAKSAKDPNDAGAKEPEKAEKATATKPVVQAITPGKAPKGGTEDKLGMTLDDVIRVQDTKKVPEPRDVKRATPGLGGKGGFRQRVAQRQMRQVKQTQMKDKAPARTMRGRGARQADREDFWGGGGGKGSAWTENGGGKGRRASDDWNDWSGPPAKRQRSESDWGWGGKATSKGSKGSKGGGKGKGGGKSWHDDWRDDSWRDDWRDDSYGQGYGYGKGGGGKGGWNEEAWGASSWRPQRPEPMLQWDRAPPVAPVQRVTERMAPMRREERMERMERREEPRRMERVERAERVERVEKAAPERSVRKTIRVCNVPKNLEERDIQEAFEDIGRVTKCEVERGVAIITFANSSHAKKAEQTFDRGELNGQTIYVSVQE